MCRQEQYRLIYEAMRQFLNRPGAYVLGSDCRAFPPTSPTQQHHASPPTTAWQAPAVASPGYHNNRQVRGPWRTPDPLVTPSSDRAANRARYSDAYQSTMAAAAAAGQRRSPGVVGGRDTAGVWAAPWRRQGTSDDVAELNVSMNRATGSDDEPGTTDVKQRWTSSSSSAAAAAAVESQSALINGTPLTAADQQRQSTSTAAVNEHERRPATTSPRRRSLDDRPPQTAARGVTCSPLTSTPLDHNAPVIT